MHRLRRAAPARISAAEADWPSTRTARGARVAAAESSMATCWNSWSAPAPRPGRRQAPPPAVWPGMWETKFTCPGYLDRSLEFCSDPGYQQEVLEGLGYTETKI